MSGARVLLTGAAGFLGAHCLGYLLANTDWEFVCPVTFSHRGLPERLTAVVDQPEWWHRVKVIKCDLACPISDITAARFGPIDYIINYAAESHVERSIADPVPFVKNNVDIALHTLEYARQVQPRAFVHLSTDEVYGSAPVGYAHKEWDPIVPSSPYSASKAAQEAIAVSYWRTYDVPVVLLNCMNLIGEMQDPEKYLSIVIKKILRGEEVPVHASRAGEIGSRYYLHARSVADAVLFLLRRGDPSVRDHETARPDRWNVVGDREINNLEMAQLVAKLLDRDFTYRLTDFNEKRPGHDLRYALGGSKLADAGWVNPVNFDDALRQLVDWAVANPEWSDR